MRASLPTTADEAQRPGAADGLAQLRAKVGAAWRRQQSAVQRAQALVEAADVAGVPVLLLLAAAVLRRRHRNRPGAWTVASDAALRDAVAREVAPRP